MIAFLLHTLETEESHSVQALLCHGISKLLLGGCVSDERVSGSPHSHPVSRLFPLPFYRFVHHTGFDQSSYGVRVASHV